MTETLGYRNVRPHGTRHAMHVKHRLQRILHHPEIYDIRVGSGCAVIETPSLDGPDLKRIRESADVEVYYIRKDGIYIH